MKKAFVNPNVPTMVIEVLNSLKGDCISREDMQIIKNHENVDVVNLGIKKIGKFKYSFYNLYLKAGKGKNNGSGDLIKMVKILV